MFDISHYRGIVYQGYLGVGIGGSGEMNQGSYPDEMAFDELETQTRNGERGHSR